MKNRYSSATCLLPNNNNNNNNLIDSRPISWRRHQDSVLESRQNSSRPGSIRSNHQNPRPNYLRIEPQSQYTETLSQLKAQNRRLKSLLFQQELHQRESRVKIAQLQDQVTELNSKVESFYYKAKEASKSHSADTDLSAFLKQLQKLHLLEDEGLSPREPKAWQHTKSREMLESLIRSVEKKMGLKSLQKKCEFIRACVKYAMTCLESVGKPLGVEEGSPRQRLKCLWRQQKFLLNYWLQRQGLEKNKDSGYGLRVKS